LVAGSGLGRHHDSDKPDRELASLTAGSAVLPLMGLVHVSYLVQIGQAVARNKMAAA
jgi:hypothetical protein